MSKQVYINIKAAEVENFQLNNLDLYSVYLNQEYRATLLVGSVEKFNKEFWNTSYKILRGDPDTTFYLKGFPYAGYYLRSIK